MFCLPKTALAFRLGPGNPLNLLRARDCGLQLFHMNEEFPVSASHKLALITSLPFVHTSRIVAMSFVSQGVGRMFCLPKTAWPPTS